MPKAQALDPLKVNERLYNQLGRLLDQLEAEDCEITTRERIAALVAIGRLQTIFVGLRKEGDEPAAVGATVTKYARTFKANAARGRAKGARRTAATAAVVEFDRHDDADDDDI